MTGIAERFDAQAARTPSRNAIAFDAEVVTYEAVRARANQLARYLRHRGVGPRTVVGVFMRQSVDLVVALLALAKVNATYVGLDTAWPPMRVAETLDDARPALVIVGTNDVDAACDAVGDRMPTVSVASAAG